MVNHYQIVHKKCVYLEIVFKSLVSRINLALTLIIGGRGVWWWGRWINHPWFRIWRWIILYVSWRIMLINNSSSFSFPYSSSSYFYVNSTCYSYYQENNSTNNSCRFCTSWLNWTRKITCKNIQLLNHINEMSLIFIYVFKVTKKKSCSQSNFYWYQPIFYL